MACVCVNTEEDSLSREDRPRNERDRQCANGDHWWVFRRVARVLCGVFWLWSYLAWSLVCFAAERPLLGEASRVSQGLAVWEEGRQGGGEGGVSVHVLGSLNECHVVANGFTHNTYP